MLTRRATIFSGLAATMRPALAQVGTVYVKPPQSLAVIRGLASNPLDTRVQRDRIIGARTRQYTPAGTVFDCECPKGLDALAYSSGHIEGEAQRAKRPLRVQLKAAGAEKVWRETASGAKTDRAQLRRLSRPARRRRRLLVTPDVILGHHPPHPKGIEVYHGKVIVYAPSNVLRGRYAQAWDDGYHRHQRWPGLLAGHSRRPRLAHRDQGRAGRQMLPAALATASRRQSRALRLRRRAAAR
jgi:hypothetical protein